MSWKTYFTGDAQAWLLDEADPGARYLTMKALLDLPQDSQEWMDQQAAAHKSGPISRVLAEMRPEGFWEKPGPGYLPKYRSTVWSIILLGQLGASIGQDPRLKTASNYLLDNALTEKGQFTSNGAPSGTVDCLQGNLCSALLQLGCDDPRLETAFEWMARTVTGEGLAPASERDAQLRYYAGKCGPGFQCGANNKLPCAWGAAKVMLAFGHLPETGHTPLIEAALQQGLEFLLSVDPADATYPCGWNDKPSGNWWKFGFPVFYVTDILQIVEALARLGHGMDPRLSRARELILGKQDELGRWCLDYGYAGKTWMDFGEKKSPNKWVTIRALHTLKLIYA